MLLSAAWRLSLLVAVCSGKVSRRPPEKDKIQDDGWPPPDLRMSPLLNEIHLNNIKWPEVLASNGEGTVISEKRPGRKSWCQTRQFQLRVTGPGCSPRSVPARFCHGQCTSLWVPRAGGSQRYAWTSCPVCRPVRGSWVTPTLLCEGGETRHASQRVFRVRKCKCRESGTDLPNALQD